jgi:hypothetical protein
MITSSPNSILDAGTAAFSVDTVYSQWVSRNVKGQLVLYSPALKGCNAARKKTTGFLLGTTVTHKTTQKPEDLLELSVVREEIAVNTMHRLRHVLDWCTGWIQLGQVQNLGPRPYRTPLSLPFYCPPCCCRVFPLVSLFVVHCFISVVGRGFRKLNQSLFCHEFWCKPIN